MGLESSAFASMRSWFDSSVEDFLVVATRASDFSSASGLLPGLSSPARRTKNVLDGKVGL